MGSSGLDQSLMRRVMIDHLAGWSAIRKSPVYHIARVEVLKAYYRLSYIIQSL